VRRTLTSLVLVASVALLTTACSQRVPAEEALKAAESAVAAAKSSVEKYLPDQWKTLNDAVKDAKDKMAKGDYSAALTAAQAIPPKVAAAKADATAKKEEFTKMWADLEGSVSGAVKEAEEKVASLVKMKKLPKGMDKAKLESAQAGLADAKKMWDDATAAAKGGDLPAAVDKAKGVKEKVAELAASLATPAPAAKTAKKKK
jgi:hypothetical protein